MTVNKLAGSLVQAKERLEVNNPAWGKNATQIPSRRGKKEGDQMSLYFLRDASPLTVPSLWKKAGFGNIDCRWDAMLSGQRAE